VEAPELEAAMLELSITLHDARLRAKSLAENVPEMYAVAEAIRHADTILAMVWDLHECTSYGDSVLDLD
jgi:ketol-acid reductoisomerase